MHETELRSLLESVATDASYTYRQQIASGYKPDVVVRDTDGRLSAIIECETTTSRKAFLGDLLKAEKYASDDGVHPTLLIVLQEKENTTVEQIANHISNYSTWLAGLEGGTLQLRNVLVISDHDFRLAMRRSASIDPEQFRQYCHVCKTEN
jgi:hypothetical protein